jgi:hypothetical protein
MDEQELRDKIKKMREDTEKSILTLQKEYAFAHKEYNIGDIITDGTDIIVIESFKYHYTNSILKCLYHGTLLKKDLSPAKGSKRVDVFNVTKKLNYNEKDTFQ